MEGNSIYITINHLSDFERTSFLKPGDKLILRKDRNNIYDDEAIIVYKENKTKVGYVANSVYSVARGTYSAGRIYDRIEEETECAIRFILMEEARIIAEIIR
ncbi:MAG: DNA-binding protein [Erysipelotrichaceae bacterium]|nr:DNA-binding protein [Erysipelotrichaceae bacterium]